MLQGISRSSNFGERNVNKFFHFDASPNNSEPLMNVNLSIAVLGCQLLIYLTQRHHAGAVYINGYVYDEGKQIPTTWGRAG